MAIVSPFSKLALMQAMIASSGIASYFKEPAFKAPPKHVTRVLHYSQQRGTYVSKDGKARMDARRNAYKLDALEAATLAPKGGKRLVRLTPHVNGFHVQYKKLAVIKYLEHIAAN